MNDFLPPLPHLSAFLFASLVLAVTPGPGVFYILARSLAQGRRVGLASVGGVALGNLGNATAAAIGLGAVFAVSSLAFTAVKWAGAAYLIWLGIQVLRPRRPAPAAAAEGGADRRGRAFRDGMVVALLNPKTTLFFAAFLPQFVSAGPAPLLQNLALGWLFVAIAAVTDCGYALAAGTVAPRLAGRGAGMGRVLAAATYIGLGIFAAATEPRSMPMD